MYVNNQQVILVDAASRPVFMLSSSHDCTVYATDIKSPNST